MLPVNDPEINTIEDCTNVYCKKENRKLDCRRCEKLRVNHTYSLSFGKYPELLVVTFKLFDNKFRKIQKNVIIRDKLSLEASEFLMEGIIVHLGETINNGHYIFYKLHSEVDQVTRFNDENVTNQLKSELLHNTKAYLIIYRNTKPSK